MPSQRNGPGLVHAAENQIVSLVEVFAIVGRVGIIGELLAAGAANPSGDQPSARDEIDHRKLFSQSQRIGHRRNRIPEQYDLHALGGLRQHRGLDVHHRSHTESGAMMLIEHHAVEAKLVAVDLLIEVHVEQFRTLLGVEEFVRNPEEAAALQHFVFRYRVVRSLREEHYVHRGLLKLGLRLATLAAFLPPPHICCGALSPK